MKPSLFRLSLLQQGRRLRRKTQQSVATSRWSADSGGNHSDAKRIHALPGWSPDERCENTAMRRKRQNSPKLHNGALSVDKGISFKSVEASNGFRRDIVEHWNSFPARQQYQQRLFSSAASGKSRPRRSPYAVLGFRNRRGEISQTEIKAAFRKLAKIYHPDLNPDNRPLEECESLMSELLEAYERLTKGDDEDFLDNIRVGASNKVALACELYSVEELILDRIHEVRALRIEYEIEETRKETDDNRVEELPSSSLPQASFAIPIQAHPGDSIMDIKERLELEFGKDWGLKDSLGWELLAIKQSKIHEGNNTSIEDDPSTIAVNNELLSYHLFLDDYQIEHGDTIYAVVRQNDD